MSFTVSFASITITQLCINSKTTKYWWCWGGGGRGVVEMTNLEHQNPQSVVVMPSSGWYEHYLVCRRVLTIFRGKGRIRQFTIPPKLPTKILPKIVLSLDRSSWGEVFTVIAKDTLAIPEKVFCTKKKYFLLNLKWNEHTHKKWNLKCLLHTNIKKYSDLAKIHCMLFMWCIHSVWNNHSFCVLHFISNLMTNVCGPFGPWVGNVCHLDICISIV